MAGVLPLLPQRHRAAPKPALLWVLGLAAVASCVITAVLASFNEELYQPDSPRTAGLVGHPSLHLRRDCGLAAATR